MHLISHWQIAFINKLYLWCWYCISVPTKHIFSHSSTLISHSCFPPTAGWRENPLWKNIIMKAGAPTHLAVRYSVSFALDCVPLFLQLSISFIACNLHPSSLPLHAHQRCICCVLHACSVHRNKSIVFLWRLKCFHVPHPPFLYKKRQELLGREYPPQSCPGRVRGSVEDARPLATCYS